MLSFLSEKRRLRRSGQFEVRDGYLAIEPLRLFRIAPNPPRLAIAAPRSGPERVPDREPDPTDEETLAFALWSEDRYAKHPKKSDKFISLVPHILGAE